MDLADILNNLSDIALYTSIRDYVYARIELLMEQILSQNLTLATSIILILMTLWVMVQGYLIATGRSQEGLKGFLFNMGKAYFIVAMALAVSSSSQFSLRTLTTTLNNGISQIMHGNDDFGSKCTLEKTKDIAGCKIDQTLTTAQAVMGFINQIDTVDDLVLESQAARAKMFAGIGTAGPAIVAGTMLIMFRIAMALFIGFAPIFILCLLFKKTAPLFQKWLYYGLATLFSSVLLGVMADISSDLVRHIATGLFVSNNLLNFVTGSNASGVMQAATQQLGLGLILSALLITVPPMAGAFFNGVMGNYSGWNAMAGWGGSSQTPPPGVAGAASNRQVEERVREQYAEIGMEYSSKSTPEVRHTNLGLASGPKAAPSTDVMGTGSQLQHGTLPIKTPLPTAQKTEKKETE